MAAPKFLFALLISFMVAPCLCQLSEPRLNLAGASCGNLAFFAGGPTSGVNHYSHTPNSDVVDIYDASTGAWTVERLSEGRGYLTAASAKDVVLFGGGIGVNGISGKVDIYNVTSRSWSKTDLSVPRYTLAAASAGKFVVFAGGIHVDASGEFSDAVDIFDVETWSRTSAKLSQRRGSLAAASDGRRLYFFGGFGGPANISTVRLDIYDTVTGRWSAQDMGGPRIGIAAFGRPGMTFFAGGNNLYNVSSTIDVLNFTTGKFSQKSMSFAAMNIGGVCFGDGKVVLAGGATESISALDKLYILSDFSSPSPVIPSRAFDMPVSATSMVAVTAGSKALFAGSIANMADVIVYDSVTNAITYLNATAVIRASPTSSIPSPLQAPEHIQFELSVPNLLIGGAVGMILSLASVFLWRRCNYPNLQSGRDGFEHEEIGSRDVEEYHSESSGE